MSNSTPNTPSTHYPNVGNSSPYAALRGRARGALASSPTKRGRKPRGALTGPSESTRPLDPSSSTGSSTPTSVHWGSPPGATGYTPAIPSTPAAGAGSGSTPQLPQGSSSVLASIGISPAPPFSPRVPAPYSASLPTVTTMPGTPTTPKPTLGEDENDGEDELLPAMADDDYSAQLSWQSQSKDNLKVLMDNFSPAQYERFEAYRRHALPKQAVRKVIQQTLGQQVSQPVAQIVAGFAKVFVGEIVEKARAVQERRGDKGPLSPDHLREAYRMYQVESGRVGSARPLRSKKLFVR